MPEPPPVTAPQPQPIYEEPVPVGTPASAGTVTRRRGPGPLARLISLIVTVGLAWALTVAITAWLLGLFLARG